MTFIENKWSYNLCTVSAIFICKNWKRNCVFYSFTCLDYDNVAGEVWSKQQRNGADHVPLLWLASAQAQLGELFIRTKHYLDTDTFERYH